MGRGGEEQHQEHGEPQRAAPEGEASPEAETAASFHLPAGFHLCGGWGVRGWPKGRVRFLNISNASEYRITGMRSVPEGPSIGLRWTPFEHDARAHPNGGNSSCSWNGLDTHFTSVWKATGFDSDSAVTSAHTSRQTHTRLKSTWIDRPIHRIDQYCSYFF